MTTEAKNGKFRQQMAAFEASRPVSRKFGVCRICFRDVASSGRIPGVRKARW